MIKQARQSLIAALSSVEATILPSWLDKMTGDLPAIAIIPPATGNYIEASEDFGNEFTIYFDLLVMVLHQDSESALDELDELVEEVLAIDSPWLAKPSVDFPSTITVGGTTLLTAVINLSTESYL